MLSHDSSIELLIRLRDGLPPIIRFNLWVLLWSSVQGFETEKCIKYTYLPFGGGVVGGGPSVGAADGSIRRFSRHAELCGVVCVLLRLPRRTRSRRLLGPRE